MVKTKFDDVIYIVSNPPFGASKPFYWKVSRDDTIDSEIRFTIDYYLTEKNEWRRTYYTMNSMTHTEKNYYYSMIRSEEEFLVWMLKYGS